MPKYNSIQEKNRISYLLNEEKLKFLKKDSQPFFYYDFNRSNKSYIPQKINSVQYFNKKIDYKKFNSTDNINLEINPEKKSKGKSSKNITNKSNKSKKSNKSNNKNINNDDIKNEINKMNEDLNKRLSKIEDLQKSQKKDIDYLMGKSKGNNKSTKSSKKEENKKEEEKKNNDNNNEESDDEEDEDDEED